MAFFEGGLGPNDFFGNHVGWSFVASSEFERDSSCADGNEPWLQVWVCADSVPRSRRKHGFRRSQGNEKYERCAMLFEVTEA